MWRGFTFSYGSAISVGEDPVWPPKLVQVDQVDPAIVATYTALSLPLTSTVGTDPLAAIAGALAVFPPVDTLHEVQDEPLGLEAYHG